MLGNEYVMTGASLNGTGVYWRFDKAGRLVAFEIKADLPDKQYEWLLTNLPKTEQFFLTTLKRGLESKGNVQIHLVEHDLSFQKFWDRYDYKVGKKKRAERLWKALSKDNKVKALQHLKKYNYHLAQNPHIQRLYPETYLNQERWNN